jgi:anti-sigma regulatory factor (Ser/Thr protein kinase)
MISRPARRRLGIATFWLVFGALSGLQIQISMLSHHHSWVAVISYQLLVWSLWIPITFAILALVRRVPLRPLRPGPLALHALVAAVFGIAHVAIWIVLELVMRPYDFMNPTRFLPRFTEIGWFQTPIDMVFYGMVVLAHYLDETSQHAHERERQAAQLEASLAEARLHALELQTQPHFLFNTLNGIGALVRAGQNQEALTMIGGLSELLRYALDRAVGGMVPLDEEAGTVRRYLEIQALRFSDRLSYQVQIEPAAAKSPVPALLLQPLVENAVRHGLSRSDAPGRITLCAHRQGDQLLIEVFNTGRLEPVRTDGIGLSNTRARLAQHYGGHASFTLAEHDGGVAARVTLPYGEAR